MREWHGILNHVLALMEQLLALGLGLLLAWFIVQAAFFIDLKHAIKTLSKVGNNWMFIILILTPFYFRTIREFLEQADEIFHIKKKREPEIVKMRKLPPKDGHS